MASLSDIRTTFIDYFKKQGHTHVASSPLVPRNDPSLLFTNAGMVQFKNAFTGQETRDYTRAVTSQKCVRAGGKHNDLDNVGYTARHHTFFEMLGNFSFGDYFKDDAIAFAWDLVTREFGLSRDRLLVTVYHTDDEAAQIWKKVAGLSDSRIIRIPTNDNFWQMGPTGPCGPCTEIFYDHGDHIPGGPPGSPDEDGDRFIEIWNLVFMQYEQFEDGTRIDLPKPSIDTGMGLERIAAILQGKHDNYDVDIFRTLIETSAHLVGGDPYGDLGVHHRVIADHLRSSAFLIADGVLPSNEGRGYVLRRIMRRAMRHAHLLGSKDPVMHRLAPTLVREMGGFFPELQEAQKLIEDTLYGEETRFKTTLDRGLRLLDGELEKISDQAPLSGLVAFNLYDTYGFPLDLTVDALREKGRTLDEDSFHQAMQAQKEKARASWAGSGEKADEPIWLDLIDRFDATEFLGYTEEKAEAHVLALVQAGVGLDHAKPGDKLMLVVNQTPFYAESGGQAGDQGVIEWLGGGRARVLDTKKKQSLFVHSIEIQEGTLKPGDAIRMDVDHVRRAQIRANHSATHLLHEALRMHLGDHVAQAGSLNDAARLRFDFSHSGTIDRETLGLITDEVNAYIRQNTPVITRVMALDEAKKLGARALFGEKYPDEIRVVSMGVLPKSGRGAQNDTYSIELCGGTHVAHTGDIGVFVITSETASASGVRRIEALTGAQALAYLATQGQIVQTVSDLLKAPQSSIVTRLSEMQKETRKLAEEIRMLKRQLARSGETGTEHTEQINGTNLVIKRLDGMEGKELPALMDEMKAQISEGLIALFAVHEGRVAVTLGVTGECSFDASKLIKHITPLIGGKGGGGRRDMAQGGGNDPDGVDPASQMLRQILRDEVLVD